MYQQTSLFVYKFRFLLATILTATFLVAIAALVTTVGSNTVLAHPSSSAWGAGAPSSTNAITAGGYMLVGDAQNALLSVGSALYGACRSVTATVQRGSEAVAHGSVAAVTATGRGAVSVARGIGSGVALTVRVPIKTISSLFSAHAVGTIIKPTDNESVPVISAQTSAAVLASFNAAEQKEIAQLQAAQLAANQQLDGAVVAGDPSHGGYPAKWDNVSQDSRLDSWGMYNRECVSYAAWKVYQAYGSMPYWGGVGNANEWPGDARRAGIATGATPAAHSVAISMHGYYGHAMWVEKVSGDMIYVSQYNYDLHGHYSEMWVNGGGFTYIYFK